MIAFGTTKYTKYTKGLERDPDDLSLVRRSEVHKKPEPQASGSEVVDQLRPMLGRYFAHGLQLDDNLLEADEVRRVPGSEFTPAVLEPQGPLRGEGNAAKLEFDLQALLVDAFEKPRALGAI